MSEGHCEYYKEAQHRGGEEAFEAQDVQELTTAAHSTVVPDIAWIHHDKGASESTIRTLFVEEIDMQPIREERNIDRYNTFFRASRGYSIASS